MREFKEGPPPLPSSQLSHYIAKPLQPQGRGFPAGAAQHPETGWLLGRAQNPPAPAPPASAPGNMWFRKLLLGQASRDQTEA